MANDDRGRGEPSVSTATKKRLHVCRLCERRRIVEPAPRKADILLCNGYTREVVLVRRGEFACAWHKTYAYELAEAERLYELGGDPQWRDTVATLKANAAAALEAVGGNPPPAPKEETK
jgi:hypothetical protein